MYLIGTGNCNNSELRQVTMTTKITIKIHLITVQPEIFARNLILRFAIENNSQNLNLANNYSLNSLCNNWAGLVKCESKRK